MKRSDHRWLAPPAPPPSLSLLLSLLLGLVLSLLLSGCGGSPPAPVVMGRVVGQITFAEAAPGELRRGAARPGAPWRAPAVPLKHAPADSEEDAEGIIVKFRPAVAGKMAASVARDLGATKERAVSSLGVRVWKLDGSRSLSETLRQLRARGDVEYAEPNRRIYPQLTPDDPAFARQWHFEKISLPGAWDVTTGSPAVVVAIIDSGVRMTHPDFAPGVFLPGYDFVDRDDDPTDPGPTSWGSDASHGTHVAGTIGAATNNGLGVAGINWAVGLMPLRVIGPQGSATDESVAEAIMWAADHGAQVINLSLGRAGQPGQTLSAAIAYAHDTKGVTLIAAAGNENGAVAAPANHPYVIAVGATSSQNRRASYSNYGPELDLVAPGGEVNPPTDLDGDGEPDWVLSTGWDFGSNQAGYYWSVGTSMAAPHVTGVAALLIAQGITGPERIRAVLRNTATDLGDRGRDDYYGDGLLNAAAALNWVRRGTVLLADAAGVRYRVQPDGGGAYSFDAVPPGTWHLAAWVDGNGNGRLDAGDRYAEYPSPLVVAGGQTISAERLPVPVSTDPSPSPPFEAAVGFSSSPASVTRGGGFPRATGEVSGRKT